MRKIADHLIFIDIDRGKLVPSPVSEHCGPLTTGGVRNAPRESLGRPTVTINSCGSFSKKFR